MPRIARQAPAGFVYHALNRAVARLPLFQKPEDYEAFEDAVAEARQRVPIEILSYCAMPNHWHFVLRLQQDGELTAFLRWLAHTHTMRWHAHYRTSGTGHLYQGRFKAFPVEDDEHFYRLVRYVERNALRAGLVARAEEWRWSSLWRRVSGDAEARSLLERGLHPRESQHLSTALCTIRVKPTWLLQVLANHGLACFRRTNDKSFAYHTVSPCFPSFAAPACEGCARRQFGLCVLTKWITIKRLKRRLGAINGQGRQGSHRWLSLGGETRRALVDCLPRSRGCSLAELAPPLAVK